MKKLFAALLALSLFLSALPAVAEQQYYVLNSNGYVYKYDMSSPKQEMTTSDLLLDSGSRQSDTAGREWMQVQIYGTNEYGWVPVESVRLLSQEEVNAILNPPAAATPTAPQAATAAPKAQQTLPPRSTNYCLMRASGLLYQYDLVNGKETLSTNQLLVFNGQTNWDANGSLWIQVQIYNTNRYGWVKVDSVWFLTQEQANPYLDPTQPTPTASPTAAPTSTPKPGGTPISRAVVTTVSGGLNLRMWASYSAPILLTIPRNATVDVYEYSGNWARIRYAGAEGWVDRSFLTDSGYYPMPTYQPSQGYAYVQTQSGGLNLRSYASYNARILMVIPRFARVEVLSYGSTWSYIRYAGVVGYVVSSYLSYSPIPVVTATPIPTRPIVGNVATVVTQRGGLNMRVSAYIGAKIVTVIPRGATVNVLSYGTTWSYVNYRGYTGYVMTGFLSYTGSSNPVVSTRALVTASGKGLNLRSYASTSAAVLTVIPPMSEVSILSRGDSWTRVRWQGYTGYAMSSYLTFLPD